MPSGILVFGAAGQVGRALQRAAAAHGTPLSAFDRTDVDITDPAAVGAAVDRAPRDRTVAVNAAAYTAVDRAEAEPDRAFAVNRDGAAHIAAACARHGLPLIHLSTDFVFDGNGDQPWREDDRLGPVNRYGAGKLAGEAAVRAAHDRHLILRTAWVYSPFGSNFVKTMLRLAADRPAIDVVDDQIGSPTAAGAIAEAILALAGRLADPAQAGPFGTYHFAGAGATSRFAFAQAIIAEAAGHGWPTPTVSPIGTDRMPTPARRPANTALDCRKIARDHGIRTAPWRQGLAPVVAELCDAAPTPSLARPPAR